MGTLPSPNHCLRQQDVWGPPSVQQLCLGPSLPRHTSASNPCRGWCSSRQPWSTLSLLKELLEQLYHAAPLRPSNQGPLRLPALRRCHRACRQWPLGCIENVTEVTRAAEAVPSTACLPLSAQHCPPSHMPPPPSGQPEPEPEGQKGQHRSTGQPWHRCPLLPWGSSTLIFKIRTNFLDPNDFFKNRSYLNMVAIPRVESGNVLFALGMQT